MKKLIKKIKKWLIYKLGGYWPEDSYTRTINYCETYIKPVHLKVAVEIPPEVCFRSYDEQCQYIRGVLENELIKLAINELPKYMSFRIEPNLINSSKIMECQFDVVPLENDDISLADLLARETNVFYAAIETKK